MPDSPVRSVDPTGLIDPEKEVVIDAGMTRELRAAMAWHPEDLPRFLRRDRESDPERPRRSTVAIALRVLAIGICATLLGLALPGPGTMDFWVGTSAFIVAIVVASTF